MFGTYFYHGLLRKYTIVLGTLLNNLTVERNDNNGNRIQSIKAPVAYGPKEKYLIRAAQDPGLDQEVAVSLPRISFERVGMFYDPVRRTAFGQNYHIVTTDVNQIKTQFKPEPWNFNYTASIMTSNAIDGDALVEQIIPYFSPDWTTQMRLIPEMSLTMDVSTVLESVTNDDAYEGDFESRRIMIWSLNFIMKGFLYAPVRRSGLIKRTQIDFHVPEDINDTDGSARVFRHVLTPGQYANGAPTSNASLTIPYQSISANSTWDYVEVDTEYSDGLVYSTESGNDNP